MNKIVLGVFLGLALAGLGLFWLQGQAQVERGAPPPDPGLEAADPLALPTADVAGLRGPDPPEATELTREQRRFFRYDRNRDGRITREEMLSTRTAAFRRLDKDGNNLLTFEEWAVSTVDRFEGADLDGDGVLTPEEFATTAPAPSPSSSPACNC